jgi:hypothetical protein
VTDLTGHRPTDLVAQDQSLFTGQNPKFANKTKPSTITRNGDEDYSQTLTSKGQ